METNFTYLYQNRGNGAHRNIYASKQSLSRYDNIVLHSRVLVTDGWPGWLICLSNAAICGALIRAIVGCALVVIMTASAGLLLFISCLASMFRLTKNAIVAMIVMSVGVVYACVVACCCAGYRPCCDVLGFPPR